MRTHCTARKQQPRQLICLRRCLLASLASAGSCLGVCRCSCCGDQAQAQGTWGQMFFAYAMQHGMDSYKRRVAPVKEQLFRDLFARYKDGKVGRLLEVRWAGMWLGLSLAGHAPSPCVLPCIRRPFS